MTERGILFQAEMVRAVLAGRKTQTRRTSKVKLDLNRCPYGKAGDRLWVREAWRPAECLNERNVLGKLVPVHPVVFRAEEHDPTVFKWKPGIHLRREHSRILLGVESVRIERAQEISETDAVAEGVERLLHDGGGCWVDYELGPGTWCNSARASFASLWRRINGAESWEANPLVYVVSFSVLEKK